MRFLVCIFLLLSGLIVSISGCKKNDESNGINNPIDSSIVKPDSLGVGWSKINVDSSSNLNDIFFKNNTVGYLTGSEGTFKSVNGGNNWIKTTSASFINLFVTPNETIFAAKGNDSIYKSTDHGISFTPTYMLDQQVNDVYAVDDNNVFTYGLNAVYKSTDAGLTWKKVGPAATSYCLSYSTIFFRSVDIGWAANGKDLFSKNTTSSMWTRSVLDTALACRAITSIYAPSDSVVYVGDFAGILYKSIDAGKSLFIIKNFNIGAWIDVHFVDDQIGYVSVGNKIFKTTDAGISWTTVVTLGNNQFSEIHFTDADHGWACGNNGIILKLN